MQFSIAMQPCKNNVRVKVWCLNCLLLKAVGRAYCRYKLPFTGRHVRLPIFALIRRNQ